MHRPTDAGPLAIPLLALVLTACGGGSSNLRPGPAPGGEGERAASSPCGADPLCRVVARTPAGTDPGGAALFVVETSGGRRSIETGAPTDDTQERSCEQRDFHVERAGTFERVLSLCNDGYGASGVGDDTVTIEPNRLVHDQYGGSAWRWTRHLEQQLVPRRLVAASLSGYWSVGESNTEDRQFDFTTFRGRVDWHSPSCGAEEAASDEHDDAPQGPAHAYLLLPRVALDPGFDPAATRVATCGTRVDATESSSFLLSGTRGDRDDAWLQVVATRTHEVLVLVHDDRFVEGADRLSVYVGPSAPSYMEHCLEPTNEHVSVVLDASSGAVIEGDPTAIGARSGRAPDGRYVRFSVPEGGAVTVAYTDADEHGVERTFATSELRDGDTHSLGAIGLGLDGLEVSCVIERRALVRAVRDGGAAGP